MRISCRQGAITDIGTGEEGLSWGAPVRKISRGPVTLLSRGAVWFGENPLDENLPGLDALLERGMAAILEQAEGRFWLVLFNSETKRLDVAADPFAGFPLYLVRNGEASHICDDPVEAGALADGAIDADAVAMMLTVGYVLAGKTLLKNVATLGPGQHLTLMPGRPESVRNYVREEREAAAGYETPDELVSDIDKSIERIGRSGRNPVLFLSGGVDSRLLASRMLATSTGFEAVSWSGQQRTAGIMDDHGAGKALAAAAGMPHHSWIWDPAGLPLSADAGICRTAGMSNNFQVWPQGDSFLGNFADSLMLWGDETFGWQRTTVDLGTVFSQLGFVPFKDERVGAFPDLLSMVLERHPFPENPDENNVSRWKQRLYSEERVASFIMKNHLATGGHAMSCSPFLSRRIVARFQNTAAHLTHDKKLARQALEISQPDAFRAVPFADYPAFDPPGRSMLIWRRCGSAISDTLARVTALSDIVNTQAYIRDLEQGEIAHRLRAANVGPTALGVDRYLAHVLAPEAYRDLAPRLRAFMQLNVNRPAGDAFPCIYAMQRFLLAVEERRARDAAGRA